MPYRRKDSIVWWASFVDASGKRVRRTTGTSNRREAKALEAKWKLEAFKANQWGDEPERNFSELMVAYLKVSAREKRSHDRDLVSVRHLRRAFGGRSLNTLVAVDIRSYIASRREQGISPSTINKEIGVLSAALNWARRELDWDVPNPVLGRKLKEPDGRVRWITRSEANALLNAASQEPKAAHLVDLIRLGLHTGMRRGEMLGLEWRRVDLREGLVYLEAENQKSGKFGSVPLNKEACNAVLSRARFRAEHCPGSPWVFAHKDGSRIQSVKNSFKSSCKRAGIQNFRIHDLRHTCAAWLVQAGVSIREVAELLRHADIRVTMRYAHLAPENIRVAVAALESAESRFGHVAQTGNQ
jgi:integrase